MSAIEAIKNGDAEVVTMTRAQAYGFVNNFGHDNEDDEVDIMDELNTAFDEAQGKANAAGVKSYILIEIEGGPTP